MTVFVGPNRPRPLAWDQEMMWCKQMETMIIPTSLHSKTLLFIHKMKDAPLNCMISKWIMWNQQWNLYYSPSNHKLLNKFNMAAADATMIFRAHSVTCGLMFLFYLFLCTYSGIVCHIQRCQPLLILLNHYSFWCRKSPYLLNISNWNQENQAKISQILYHFIIY